MKDKKKYVSLMVIAAITSLLKSLLFAKVLPIASFGTYSLAILASSYILFLTNLGLEPGFLKQGAKYFGMSQCLKLRGLNSQIFSTTLLVFLAVSAASVLLFLSLKVLVPDVEFTFFLAGIVAGSNFLFGITTTYLRITQHFLYFSAFLAARNFLALALGYYLSLKYDANGALWAEIISYLLVALIIAFKYRFAVRTPKRKILSPLVKAGYPFSLNYLFRALTQNTDRWVITYALGTTAVGLYSFSMIIFTAGIGILNILTQPMVSTWLSQFGRDKSAENLNENIRALIIKCYKYLSPLMLIFIFASPWLIDAFFPKYAEAKTIIIIVCFATVINMTNIFDTSLIAQKKGRALIVITVINFIISAILYAIGYFLGATLPYYAAIFAIAQLILLVLTYLEATNFNFKKSTAS